MVNCEDENIWRGQKVLQQRRPMESNYMTRSEIELTELDKKHIWKSNR